MAFLHFGNMRFPDFPGVSHPSGGYWRGTGEDSLRMAFDRDGVATIAGEPCYTIAYTLTHGDAVATGNLSPVYFDVNGFGFWGSTSYTLAHSPSYGWAFSMLPPGLQPREYDETTATRHWDTSAGEWVWELSSTPAGDAFFTGAIPSVGGRATWNPRGSERREEASAHLSLSAFWPRLERSASAGDGLAGYYGAGFDGWEGASAIVGYPPPSGASGEDAGKYTMGDTVRMEWVGDLSICH